MSEDEKPLKAGVTRVGTKYGDRPAHAVCGRTDPEMSKALYEDASTELKEIIPQFNTEPWLTTDCLEALYPPSDGEEADCWRLAFREIAEEGEGPELPMPVLGKGTARFVREGGCMTCGYLTCICERYGWDGVLLGVGRDEEKP